MPPTSTSKERILASARKLFGDYGYAETTFKRISEDAGVALGLISHYFGNKEKLFVSSSLSVLEEVEARVMLASSDKANGLEAAMAFVTEYLDCSVDPDLNFLILVRCSPYSDIKIDLNKDDIIAKFEELIHGLARCLIMGMKDGSVIQCESMKTADVVFALVVGSVRTRLLAPFCPEGFYDEVLAFLRRSIAQGA